MAKIHVWLKIFLMVLLIFSCEKTKHPVEDVYVNIYIDLSDPQYFNLTATGNPVYITGGVKGIIVMRTSNYDFVAFDRNCPYQAEKKIAVKITGDNLYARCDSCKSKFLMYDGSVVNGPSKYPLKSYQTSLTSNVLHIYN